MVTVALQLICVRSHVERVLRWRVQLPFNVLTRSLTSYYTLPTTISTIRTTLYASVHTGTPIQNNLEELWTLLHIIDPHKFQRIEDFVRDYGNVTDSNQVAQLQALLRPYLLRRLKEDVAKNIPPKEETIIEVCMGGVGDRWMVGRQHRGMC